LNCPAANRAQHSSIAAPTGTEATPITSHAMPFQTPESIVRYDANIIPDDSMNSSERSTKMDRSGGARAFFCSTESLFLRHELNFLELVKTRRGAKILQ
jgi:hypothetical protein